VIRNLKTQVDCLFTQRRIQGGVHDLELNDYYIVNHVTYLKNYIINHYQPTKLKKGKKNSFNPNICYDYIMERKTYLPYILE